jgi:hypothetical protein
MQAHLGEDEKIILVLCVILLFFDIEAGYLNGSISGGN